jgi:hypothetical protein
LIEIYYLLLQRRKKYRFQMAWAEPGEALRGFRGNNLETHLATSLT